MQKLEAEYLLHHLPTITLQSSAWILWSSGGRSLTLCSLQHYHAAVPQLQPHIPWWKFSRPHSLVHCALTHITSMEHIPTANPRVFIQFFLSSVLLTSESFFCASSVFLVLWDVLQYSGTMIHFQCFITTILTNHTCLHQIARGCSCCLPHGLPGVHCRFLGRRPTWKFLWRPKIEKYPFLPISKISKDI